MEEKYCLKGDYNLLNEAIVSKELNQRGVTDIYRRIPNPAMYLGYEMLVTQTAFGIVCDMLIKTRRELSETRKK